MDRDRHDDDDDSELRMEFVTHASLAERAASRGPKAPAAGRLAPRPDKGLSFDAALDETSAEHRAVFAALAK